MSPEFLITTLIIVASPGIGATYTIAAGLNRGAKASVWAAFACTLGIVPHLLAAMTGLAALLHASALLFEIVKYAGVAYLLYMAWAMLKERGSMKIDAGNDARGRWQVIVDGILINLLNPKLSIFFVSFLPQFISPAQPNVLAQMMVLSSVFMLATFVIFTLYGLFASTMRDRVLSSPTVLAWMRRTFAAAFVALGAKLALSER
ncbi:MULTISPECIES: LysE family translocator [unclassified Beijerinckia]|uniref:LysE family translocator n=1 Tax=unclassified Beijerinckia TaxID=2638183 RepID=UPI00089B288D|nr:MULTISPECIES: LysE family translocator [unclassified Beijerinckia]MDH7798038.1 threonine/homoserine/homoserine lactone efflux protein [Beijerinckia sp. GAS462]SED06804.1 Threonine/homoserine/homoserine lactone efflux protein [Beijerinckia sp. 28-YEA-48]